MASRFSTWRDRRAIPARTPSITSWFTSTARTSASKCSALIGAGDFSPIARVQLRCRTESRNDSGPTANGELRVSTRRGLVDHLDGRDSPSRMRFTSMSIAPETLLESKQRVVRVVGRELLAKVREKSEDLGVDEERDAVHDFRVALRRLRSWLRAFGDELAPTVRPKVSRRLKRIADATRVSRDCEVHIEWLENFAKSQRGKYR